VPEAGTASLAEKILGKIAMMSKRMEQNLLL